MNQLEAILELARRYDYDAGHSHQVECLAGSLFLELQPLHGLGRAERKLLEYAAILHDIGYYNLARGHHKHALQMIMIEPLPELSREEKSIVANLARYHRKSLPKVDHTAFGILSEEAKQTVMLLAPLLRIADALDRSHTGKARELSCEINPDNVVLRIGSDTDMPEEQAALKRKTDMFREVYKREIVLQVIPPRIPSDVSEADFAYELA